jgi:1-deoxy-D-xylulose-5-phosphate reductoisomerase
VTEVRKLVILGSTGSIGRNTLDLVRHHRDRFEVVGLVAGRQTERLADQIREFRPQAVAVADETAARELGQHLHQRGLRSPEVRVGSQGAAEVVVGTNPHVVVAGIVGASGLIPTLSAVNIGSIVALANKEALVVAGELMVRAARESGASLLPVDSEHNAIHQCLRAGRLDEVRRLILTASGGPFRGVSRRDLQRITPEQALAHPTWRMGPKISIDSATLMNKGLEVIEACFLFALPSTRIDVMVHPQSVVHSLVEYRDGSLIAQLGTPDMRHPIQYALTFPERWEGPTLPLDLIAAGTLSFEPPDRETFPCLDLAYRAWREGGDAAARLNAANEVAVAAFLERRIGFDQIPRIIEGVMDADAPRAVVELDELLDADRRGRETAQALISRERTGSR